MKKYRLACYIIYGQHLCAFDLWKHLVHRFAHLTGSFETARARCFKFLEIKISDLAIFYFAYILVDVISSLESIDVYLSTKYYYARGDYIVDYNFSPSAETGIRIFIFFLFRFFFNKSQKRRKLARVESQLDIKEATKYFVVAVVNCKCLPSIVSNIYTT